jgi:hypothetical protein
MNSGVESPEPSKPALTLGQFCESRLAAVCGGRHFAARTDEILEVYRDLSSSWSTRSVNSRPPWSGLTCDLTPFEISVSSNLSGDAELQFLVEPQDEPPSPDAYWGQSRALIELLEYKWQADTSQLRSIEDLVQPRIGARPTQDEGASCTGYGVVFRDQQRFFKFWFNPDCQGVRQTDSLCRKVMERLGFSEAWGWTRPRLPPTSSMLFGLDLSGRTPSRVKLYVRILDPDLSKVEDVAALADNYLPGDVRNFWGSLGWGNFPIMRPHLVELQFAGHAPRPVRYALQFSTFPFLPNDALVRRCVRASLRRHGISRHLYDATLEALVGHRDLETESLVHSWVTFKRDEDGKTRIAVYFPGRAYFPRFGALGVSPREQWPYAYA